MQIGTHNGVFHADDVFACAALMRLFRPDAEIVRTRDPKVLDTCDIIVDVGGVYDTEKGRFDHHQIGGAGQRPNGVKYSSFGLVWLKYGAVICDSVAVAETVDKILVQGVDALDNGQGIITDVMSVSQVISGFNPEWDSTLSFDERFVVAMDFAETILRNAISAAYSAEAAKSLVKEAVEASDGELVLLDRFFPFVGNYLEMFPEGQHLFFVFPSEDGQWRIQCIPKVGEAFSKRKALPASWAGKRDAELNSIVGADDCVFCHNGRFIAGAKSRETILKMAQLAIDEVE